MRSSLKPIDSEHIPELNRRTVVLSGTYERLLEQASRLRREQAAGLLAYALPSYSDIASDVDVQRWANLWIGDDE